MGTLSLSPLTAVPCSLRSNDLSSRKTKTHLSNSITGRHVSSNAIMAKLGTKTVVFRANSRDPKESMFMDENGVVDDMDGYLNHLSPEYDSVWDTKPSWCQPWTIVLTGGLAIAFSWLIFHLILVTALISLLVCTWWYIFLYSYPKAYVDMIAERRKKVMNGVEDTFGLEKNQ